MYLLNITVNPDKQMPSHNTPDLSASLERYVIEVDMTDDYGASDVFTVKSSEINTEESIITKMKAVGLNLNLAKKEANRILQTAKLLGQTAN